MARSINGDLVVTCWCRSGECWHDDEQERYEQLDIEAPKQHFE